jgi:hypothetical protein
VLDLFPQTSAVETLVHLSRQPKKRLRWDWSLLLC